MSTHVTGDPSPEGALPRTILGDGVVRVRAERLGVAVVRDLVTAVVTGEVAPGDILPPEGVLSQQFAVSRTVIRESVKRVEEKGLVTVSQGRGTIVNPPSMWNVLDPDVLSALVDHDESLEVLDELAVVRGSLEATMARAAADRQTPERTAELRDAFDRSVAHADDLEAYNAADAAFHDVVMEQSGNRLAANITRIMFTRARESRRFTGNTSDDSTHLAIEEHRAVLEAIVAGDGDTAASAMREHIAKAWARRRSPGAS
jgi:DNA-binding FadR family transcriptional regulator